MSLRIRSLPPGQSVVTILWSPQPAAKWLERHGQIFRIDTKARQRSSSPKQAQSAFKCGLVTQCFYGDVDALS